MNKLRIIVGGGCALLMSPLILIGALGAIICRYVMCGVDMAVLAAEELDKWLDKYDEVSK